MAAPPLARWHTRPPGAPAPAAAFLAITAVDIRSATAWERHRHQEHELILACAGDYRCTLNDAELALAPGEALVVQPGDWHADRLAAGTRYLALWFRLPPGLFAPEVAAAQQVVPRRARLDDVAGRLHDLAAGEAGAARLDLALAALLGALVDGLDPAARGPAFAPPDDGFAARLDACFARLPAGRAGGEQLARACGLPRRTLERRCREALGCGPAEAHARWRLRRAGELLRTTDWPVRAVSEALGFANPFHFSRAFARLHGAPPAAWRTTPPG